MKKYLCHMLVVLLVFSALIGMSVQAEGNEFDPSLKLRLPEKMNPKKITSLRFSILVDTSEVIDQEKIADLRIAFEGFDSKVITKSRFNEETEYLNVYIAGTDSGTNVLPWKDNTLPLGKIHAVDIEGKEINVERIQVRLVRDTMEFISSANARMEFPETVRTEATLKGDAVAQDDVGDTSDPGTSGTPTDPSDPTDPSGPVDPGESTDPGDPSNPSTPTDPQKPGENEPAIPPTGEVTFETAEEAKIALEGKLFELDQLLSSEYTAETWNPLSELMEQARELLQNDNVDKEQIEKLYNQILEQQQKLVKADEQTGQGGQGGSGQGGSTGGSGQGGTGGSTGGSGQGGQSGSTGGSGQGGQGGSTGGSGQGGQGGSTGGSGQGGTNGSAGGSGQNGAGTAGSGSGQANTGANGTANHPATVQTGDQSNVVLWVVLAVVALAAIVGVVIWKKKKK